MPFRMRKNVKVELLSRVPLFSGLSKAQLGQVAMIADEIDLPAGTTVIREGERGREFLVVIEGEVEVRRKGKRLAVLRDGEFVGEIALVSDIPRVATVTTCSPVRALVITDRQFRSLIQRVPTIALKVLDAVATRLPTAQF